MIQRVIIISGKASAVSVNRAEGSGELSEPLSRGFRGAEPPKKIFRL